MRVKNGKMLFFVPEKEEKESVGREKTPFNICRQIRLYIFV